VINEEWRSIPLLGFPDRYQVSNFGSFRTLAYVDRRGWNRRERIIKCADAQISIRLDNGQKKWFALAALILHAFVGPPPKGCRLSRHLDDDRSNNRLDNLAWGTDLDNIRDAKSNFLHNGKSFASYGRLGKPCSEETKIKIRQRLKGRPSGRKITESHRLALLTGYRLRFPEVHLEPVLCVCGCGIPAKPGNRFIHGHTGGRKRR
jgi:HNH endonuclease/NUMOD4 motif